MNDLQRHWNESTARLPENKDPSSYARERLSLFPKNATVADVGGGSGEDAVLFAQHGHKVILIDINDMDIAKSVTRAENAGVQDRLETRQQDLSNGRLPLEPNSCDVIYSRLALHFFEPSVLIELLSQIYKALRCGGKAYMTLKSPEDKAEMAFLTRSAVQKRLGVFEDKGIIKTRLTAEQLVKSLEAAEVKPEEFSVKPYVEKLEGRTDTVKSNSSTFLLNEIIITKACA